jgi:hypothetical protein
MAIWQHRLILLPEDVVLRQYDVLPLTIPMELAEDFAWWSDVQPPAGFERKIDLILPPMESWFESKRMWGQKHGDDGYVCYVDKDKKIVEEIAFRVDARTISLELVRRICSLATDLGCVFMTSEYEILAPDQSMVLANINHSTAKKFVDDPVSTFGSGCPRIDFLGSPRHFLSPQFGLFGTKREFFNRHRRFP